MARSRLALMYCSPRKSTCWQGGNRSRQTHDLPLHRAPKRFGLASTLSPPAMTGKNGKANAMRMPTTAMASPCGDQFRHNGCGKRNGASKSAKQPLHLLCTQCSHSPYPNRAKGMLHSKAWDNLVKAPSTSTT